MPFRIDPDKISIGKHGDVLFDGSNPSSAAAVEALAARRFGTLATNEVCNGTHPACTNTKDCALGSNTNCNNKGSCFTPNPGPGQG
ncbi:hypothetical protein KHF85_18035 [Xanthomonas translucens pv. graminis]|uniref:hypothetical protein n=1 Tax=Xanthomonas graminis TaxID=3390026 RepID=UPI002540A217|nr:hypothetical protein [Xanthomonas translucens]WIH04646.1 hypothetical protein KHF85_18035 [Xanthomonas translucens pv. graminis]